MHSSRIIAEDDGYMITYHKNEENASDKVVLSFGGAPSKKTQMGFGSRFILSMGYDHIFVAQEELSQYQKLSLEEFTESVSPVLDGKNVYTYGSSLGAYAAIYYGGSIDAHIIASAPKNSAHSSMKTRQFQDLDFMHKELSEVPKSSKRPLILHDPYRKIETDYINNHVLPVYPDSRVMEFPFAGHEVLRTLKESGVLKEFIATYIESGECIPVQLKTEDSHIWHTEKGRFYAKNLNLERAVTHFQKSVELSINKHNVSGLARLYFDMNELQKARTLINDYKNATGSLNGISPRLLKSLGIKS